ncbi:MAG: AAA family ATPase [Patescibacteria group bacterium]|nr:AAA family ATPase [Patescibacteria group bacterium]
MIIGNQESKNLVINFLERERGSLLVYGPEGVGKFSFLKEILQQYSGEKIILDNENRFFSLETARLLTLLGKQKKKKLIIVINDAHKFSHQAQNIFLKTIEEIVTPTIFIFITHQLSKILPTIRSRSLLIKFSLIPEKEVEDLLTSKGYKNDDIKLSLFFYPHQPGKAISLINSKNKLKILRKFFDSPPEEKLLLIDEIKKNFQPKEFIELYLIGLRRSFSKLSLAEAIKIKEITNLYFDLEYNLNIDVQMADLILNYG